MNWIMLNYLDNDNGLGNDKLNESDDISKKK